MRIYAKTAAIKISILTAVLILLLLNVGCAKSPEERRLERIRSGDERLNVILISVDTLRADALGCYGGDIVETPNIDRLAAEGTLFTECKSPAPITLPSHTTMLTGTFPPFHGVHNNLISVPDDGLIFLSEILKEHGYRTGAIVGSFQLDDIFGFDQGFDYYDDEFTVGTGGTLAGFEKPANQVMARAEAWLEENRERPFFLFVHFFDPHLPYVPPKKFYEKHKDNPYYGEVAFVDEVMGNLLPALRRTGLTGDTLIVITADHGESLGEHGEQTHVFFVYEATQHVPLIMYCPGLVPAGKTIEGPVRLADICPTVLDILGIEQPESIQGETLVPLIFGNSGAGRVVYEESYYGAETFGWARLYALEKDGWKYIDAPHPELYNLTEDPGELVNLFDKNPSKATRMSEDLEEIKTRLAENGVSETEPVTLSDRDKARLETLGYLTRAELSARTDGGADPKDKVKFIKLYAEYYESLTPLDIERHVGVLEKMIEAEPKIAFPYNRLGSVYAASEDYDEAESFLKKALELQPTYNETRLTLADVYMSVGKYDEADELLYKVENDPTATPVDLATAFYRRGKLIIAAAGPPEKAARYYKKAIELQRDYADPYFELVNIYENTPGGEVVVEEYARKFVELEPRGVSAAKMRAILGQEPVEELAAKASKAYEAGNYDEAAEYCRRAYELDPTYYEMRYNLVCCLALGGHPDEATAELERLIRDVPGVFDEAIARDPDLDSLRNRDDFNDLLN